MAEQTDNYALTLPDENDFYNVEDFNGNMEKIDTELKNAQDKADQAFQSASNGKAAIKAAITGLDPEVTVPTNATFAQLAAAIGQIETGVDTEDATATAAQILDRMTAYVKSVKVTGTMPNQAGKSIVVANHAGAMSLVVDSGDNRMGVIDLPNQTGVTGYIDSNTHFKAQLWGLLPENIKAGANIGQYPGYGNGNMAGTFTNDADAVPGDMVSGKKAYVKGVKVTGTIPVVNPDYSDQIGTGAVSVGAYSGDDANYAYMHTGLNGKYSSGINYVRHYEPYLRPENILSGASIMGVNGAAIAGKRFASGIVTSTPTNSGWYVGAGGQGTNLPNITVSGLTFLPSLIVVIRLGVNITDNITYCAGGIGLSTNPAMKIILHRYSYAAYQNQNALTGMFGVSDSAYITNTGFNLPVIATGTNHAYYAFE